MSVCEYADRSDGAVVLRSAASKDAEAAHFVLQISCHAHNFKLISKISLVCIAN